MDVESGDRRSLRIAMISNYLPSGSKIGVGYQVHALANGLVDRGHDVVVYSACAASEGSRYRTEMLALPSRWRTFAFARAVGRLDLSRFDVVHAHGDDYWLRGSRVPPHLRTMHGSCFAEAVRISGVREKVRMAALGITEVISSLVADRTVLVSPQTRAWLPWVREVVPNGVGDHLFASTSAHPDAARSERPTILFVGTYARRKRGRLLQEIFRQQIRPAVPDAQLVMVCSDAPQADGVVVTGRLSDADLAAWYRRAWVFCLPSTYEGFGIPYAEALAAGLPIVASPNAGARYVLDGGRAGQICRDQELGDRLLEILTDSEARTRFAKKGMQRRDTFRMSGVLDRYEDCYRSLIAARSPSLGATVGRRT